MSLAIAILLALARDPKPLFDGKSFDGWEGGAQKWWRIEGGSIVGGSLKETVPAIDFLATTAEVENFVLRVKFRLLGTKDFINSGVRIRSQRVPDRREMKGYPCDLGDPTWWGSIYDESRRNRVQAPSDMAALDKVLKRGDWNDFEIRAEGPRIVTKLNGVVGVDWTEDDGSIPFKGRIGFQVHGGGAAEVWFKDVTLQELPPTPPAAPFTGAPDPPGTSPKPSPLSPEEQKAAFTLPPGFEIELVASELDGVAKPITVAWDHAGRLWTMTAVEYPVDANEDATRAAALYRDGGRDRVLVIDAPGARPRVFAEKLAIPLGLLPYKDGAFVQYGSELRFYRDRDGDGRADGFDTVLRGFGVEDSHLLIHQFTRGPGGWIYMAQGAFNRTRVRTLEGHEVRWDFCKMARMQPDGSRFELCQAGLNNIWGFVVARSGEMFIQEANDMGYPVVPFPVGGNYPGIGNEKLRPYAPFQPPLATFQMGGTGLSGLAAAEDRDGWPEPYAGVFYVANPIMRRIQAIRVCADGPHHKLQKLPDFVLCSDEWFRPIAIHFGPDRCLYIVDWYNKIISHNEVPRNHPDRDKTRGRIWRVRHKDQPKPAVPDLAKAAEADLLKSLESDGTWEGRAAWMEIVDRGAAALEPGLRRIAEDRTKATDARLRALWALEGLRRVAPETLAILAADPDRNLRREAIRCGAKARPEDPDPQVRAETIRGATSVELLARMAGPKLAGKSAAAHDRDFERYLVRASLEKRAPELAAFLDSDPGKELPVENRLLASLALDPKASAARVAAILPSLARPPDDEELLRLAEFSGEPGVGEAVHALFRNPALRAPVLESLLRVRARLDLAKLTPLLTESAKELLGGDAAARDLALRLGAAFRLSGLEDALLPAAEAGQVAALKALREMGSARVELFAALAKKEALREEALFALAAAPGGRGAELFFGLAAGMNARERRLGVERLAGSPAGAKAVVKAFQDGALPVADLDGALLERLQVVLKEDAALKALVESNASLFRPVLLLEGKGASSDVDLALAGPFTVETWVRLAPGITNADSLLGGPGMNINFHDGRARLWAGDKHHDVIVAKKAMAPDTWVHVAVTRDAAGKCRIYLNGELDTEPSKTVPEAFEKLDIGWTHVAPGTAGSLMEFRIWDRARTADEIRAAFDRALEAEKGMTRFDGAWGKLRGGARVVKTTDFPALLTPAEAKAVEEKFAAFRALAAKPGDAARGREIFGKTCAACHTAEGKGGQIGPALSGAGAMGTEALLRNLLTPNAAMEPGYRAYRIQTRDGDVFEGFLVKQDADALLLRVPGAEDRRVAQKEVRQGGYTRRSMMPEGLLEAIKPGEVADLFAYLRSLR